MPNFDALRSAIIGPMAYICRPKPVTPCFLFPLNQTTSCLVGNGNISFGGGSSIKYGLATRPWYCLLLFQGYENCYSTLTASTTDIVGDEWTLEFFCDWYAADRNAYCTLNFAGFQYKRTKNALTSFTFGGSSISLKSHTYSALTHSAFVYTGGKLRIFENGSLIDAVTLSLAPNPQSAIINTTQIQQTGVYLSNLRLVPKALGTSTSFPVPSTLYTGYEAL